MERLVAEEGGLFPFNFDQREEYPDVPPVIIQGLLVAPERKRRIETPAGTPEEPRLTQTRQSRITAALAMADPKFAFRPDKTSYPDIGIRFDRANAASSLAGRGLDSRPSLENAKRQKTTTSLSGLPPLEPNYKLVDLNVPFGTAAVAVAAGPSEFKLATLTNAGGGLRFDESRNYYHDLAASRSADTESAPSTDPHPEIPWLK